MEPPCARTSDSSSPGDLPGAIIQSCEDAIFSKTLDGVITSWNKAATQMFGYSESEMIGQPIAVLFPPDRSQEGPEILRRLKRGHRVGNFESVRLTKDGRHIDVSLTISPVRNAAGAVVGASKVAREITHQKLAQQRLALSFEEMKRTDRTRADFIATLSHELRTPLNAIIGWLDILKESHNEDDVRQAILVIERNSKCQVQLIEELLDMSRIETGKMSIDLQPLDIASVCSTSITSIEPTLKAKNLRLTKAFEPIRGVVMGDHHRIQQVISNLLTNAAKFTPKGGQIHVRVKQVDATIELTVQDTGIGLTETQIPHIFDRFRQGDASIARHYGGLGLGLSIAKNLVELHNGQLTAMSKGKDLGATFTVTLPIEPLV